MIEQGMKPKDVCVDYGCGSLRIGIHLMNFLKPRHYWGLDVTDQFYSEALKRIDPEAIKTALPNLGVITTGSFLERTTKAKPTYLICVGVLNKVPFWELSEFFRNFMSVIGKQTKAYLKFRTAEKSEQISLLVFAHTKEQIDHIIRSHGGLCNLCGVQKKINREGIELYDQCWCIVQS